MKSRVAQAVEPFIQETQFGFRQGKSTAEPLFCVRRLTDVAEQGNDPLFLLFLDWEKAFDKIDQSKMFASLRRLNIPDYVVSVIEALYRNPEFQVSHKDHHSAWLRQRTGIRQGCPLSPYLFILTMHCMFHDVKQDFNDPRNQKTFQGINFQELLYADDTLILAKSAHSAKKFLHIIEKESQYLQLNLNKDKCSFISFNCHGTIQFSDGERMKSVEEATYLGMSVTSNHDPRHEIRKRISATMPVLKKLDIFWLKAQCSRKWKLIAYNAVITAKVLYGLETLEPTKATANLLNTFQLKGLRKILRLHTTFIQRNNTNEYIYKRANQEINAPTDGPNRKIKPLTEILEGRKLKMLGHIMRRPRQNPLHQATFATASAIPKEARFRRVGRPRQFWTVNNMEKAWSVMKELDASLPGIPFDKRNADIRKRLVEHAQLYRHPFG